LDNTKRFLKKNQKHVLKLKEMIKEQEQSKRTQIEEKEEEIKILKNGIGENEKVNDENRKSLEVIVHLKT
jgi:predicted RND superfamily exporter protein